MKRPILALPLVLCLTTVPGWAPAQESSGQAGGNSAGPGASSLDALFSQATFWRANNRPDLARDALRRVLAVEPGNPRALRGMGELALAAEDRDGARQWLDRLLAEAPGSEEATRLQAAMRREKISNGDLMEARALAKAGNAAGAVARYEALFNGVAPTGVAPTGSGPPPDLALEYYQTLAGVDDRWREAREGLEQVVRDNPNNPAARQALAEVLTYRQVTRNQGIEQLAGLWRDQERLQVLAPWRQALLWLPEEPASAQALRDYLAVRPDDPVVRERLDSVLSGNGGAAVADAYDALEAGRLSAARRAFEAVLKDDPESAEAVAGLGLADLRQGRFGPAEQRLTRAIRMAPERRKDWAPALEDARFYGRLAEARALNQQQNYDQALQAVIPLARAGGRRGRDAALLQGEILLGQDRPQVAETVFRDLLENDGDNNDARVGLVRALMAQERYDEANRIYAELPAEERMRYGYVRDQQSQVLRERAQVLIDSGQVYAGEALLHEAVAAAPGDPWARLALAKRMQARGQSAQAAAMLEPLEAPGSEPQALLAAAQFAADQGRWRHALDLLDRLPADARDSDSQALRQRAENGLRLAELARLFDSGDRWRIQSELERLYAEPPETPAQTGELASFLVDHGESSLALTLVRKDLSEGLERGAPKDFVPHALVLGRLGYDREAGELLRELQRRAEQQPGGGEAFADARRTLSVASVDHARQGGDFARAYDEAVMALSSDPDNEALVLALGRVYQEGGFTGKRPLPTTGCWPARARSCRRAARRWPTPWPWTTWTARNSCWNRRRRWKTASCCCWRPAPRAVPAIPAARWRWRRRRRTPSTAPTAAARRAHWRAAPTHSARPPARPRRIAGWRSPTAATTTTVPAPTSGCPATFLREITASTGSRRFASRRWPPVTISPAWYPARRPRPRRCRKAPAPKRASTASARKCAGTWRRVWRPGWRCVTGTVNRASVSSPR